MNCTQVMKELKSFGSAQTRKTYARHGIIGPMFGVSFAHLNKFKRKVGVDHELGLQLWHTGNFDARVFASMITDPSMFRIKDLVALLKDVDCHALASVLSNMAQRSPGAASLLRKWIARKSELVSTTGWMMLAGITRERPELFTKAEYHEFLKTIESEIQQSPNRTKHAMNLALIGIGTYIDEKRALSFAKRIGEVEIDHGDTSCRTKQASPYIRKAAAKHRAKLSKQR